MAGHGSFSFLLLIGGAAGGGGEDPASFSSPPPACPSLLIPGAAPVMLQPPLSPQTQTAGLIPEALGSRWGQGFCTWALRRTPVWVGKGLWEDPQASRLPCAGQEKLGRSKPASVGAACLLALRDHRGGDWWARNIALWRGAGGAPAHEQPPGQWDTEPGSPVRGRQVHRNAGNGLNRKSIQKTYGS